MKKAKAEYVVVTRSWWENSSVVIEGRFKDKKKALDKAHELYDNNLMDGQNAWVMSKSAFKSKYPAVFREEY